MPSFLNAEEIIEIALKEDAVEDDVTTSSMGLVEKIGWARLMAKEDLVFSGTALFEKTMKRLEPQMVLNWHFKDGDLILSGQSVCTLKGNLVQILKAERVALNFVGHLSGIATFTRCFVKRTEGTKCKILDTRKTLPGLRPWQKLAVIHGGGHNHRMDLASAILIKDNHIRMTGGINSAVKACRTHSTLPIEVEATTLEEVQAAVNLKVDRILLDNMDNNTMAQALKLIPRSIATEASGGMVLERVESVAKLGVNYISVGALTHSAPNADLSLEFEWEE